MKYFNKTYFIALCLLAINLPQNSFSQQSWDIVLDEKINGISKVDNFGFNGSFGFAHSPDNRLWKTHNGGKDWSQETVSGFSPKYPATIEGLKQIHFFDSLSAIFRYEKGFPHADVYYSSTDGGKNLTYVSDSTFSGYTFTTKPNTRFADKNTWYVWKRALRTADSKLIDVIFVTHDAGKTWKDISTNLYNNYSSSAKWTVGCVQFLSSTIGYCSGEDGVYKTTDGGSSWNKVNAISNANGEIHFVDEQNGYIAADKGSFNSLQKTTDGGSTFTSTTLTKDTRFQGIKVTKVYDIDFLDATNGVATCNANGTPFMARTEDGGQNWIQDTIPQTILSHSSNYSGFMPVQMVTKDAAFTQIHVNSTKRYIIGFGQGQGGSGGPSSTDFITHSQDLFTVYPNPSNSEHTVTIKLDHRLNSLTIINSSGQVIDEIFEIENEYELQVNNYKPGIYFLIAKSSTNTEVKKLIIN